MNRTRAGGIVAGITALGLLMVASGTAIARDGDADAGCPGAMAEHMSSQGMVGHMSSQGMDNMLRMMGGQGGPMGPGMMSAPDGLMGPGMMELTIGQARCEHARSSLSRRASRRAPRRAPHRA
jgi:hypothetical protein